MVSLVSGDDLTITLFLVGLAINFGVAGMSQAGWKHRLLIASLFLLAVTSLATGLGWPWVKGWSPTATAIITQVATSGIAWFVVIMVGLGAFLFVRGTPKAPRQVSDDLADSAELRLHLYGDNRFPTRVSGSNDWRYYYLHQTLVGIDKETGRKAEHVVPLLVFSFEKPIKVGTLEVNSSDFTLPRYEVKEFNNRFAVIVFYDALPAGSLNLRAHI